MVDVKLTITAPPSTARACPNCEVSCSSMVYGEPDTFLPTELGDRDMNHQFNAIIPVQWICESCKKRFGQAFACFFRGRLVKIALDWNGAVTSMFHIVDTLDNMLDEVV